MLAGYCIAGNRSFIFLGMLHSASAARSDAHLPQERVQAVFQLHCQTFQGIKALLPAFQQLKGKRLVHAKAAPGSEL